MPGALQGSAVGVQGSAKSTENPKIQNLKSATPDICRELGAQVYHFPWPDSFAIARNESLKHARGEWIFWMDSDDVIDADNGRQLRDFVAELVRVPALLPLPPGEGRDEGASSSSVGNALSRRAGIPQLEDGLPSPSSTGKDGLGIPARRDSILGYVVQVHCPSTGKDGFRELTVVDQVKLFRNRPDLRFAKAFRECETCPDFDLPLPPAEDQFLPLPPGEGRGEGGLSSSVGNALSRRAGIPPSPSAPASGYAGPG